MEQKIFSIAKGKVNPAALINAVLAELTDTDRVYVVVTDYAFRNPRSWSTDGVGLPTAAAVLQDLAIDFVSGRLTEESTPVQPRPSG